ncbi:MAG: hypothetical protein HY885_17705 [Deltaproteobacteria bacterium]|nr:hypothetical protein [Deltaproteobacteria bacterium]
MLDAGALLFDNSALSAGREEEQARINAQGLVEAYNLLGYEAVGISTIDLLAGIDFLQQLHEKSIFPWLSANLVHPESKQPFFTPYILKEKNGLRIAIIGITGTEPKYGARGQEKYLILPWRDVLPKLLEELRGKADVYILLSSESKQENQLIAKDFNNIHIIIQSGTNAHNENPVLTNNTLICQTEKQGKYLGKMRINWNSSAIWANKSIDTAVLQKQEYDRIAWQIKRLQEKGDPEQVYKDKPATLKAYYKLAERMKILEEETRKQQTGKNQATENATFEHNFLEVEPTIADDPTIEKITKETKNKINAIGRKESRDNTIQPDHVGSQACMSCHEEIAKRWQLTPHARAYETLVKKDQQFNANCLPCHVTGISMEDKNKSLSLPDTLHNVGCESCHGPGKKHVENPEKWKLNGLPGKPLCLQCHLPEHDDSFDYDKDSKLVH